VPASRPSWKGYLKLALVSCPVALWPVTAPSERIAFRQINKKTGNRIRYQSIDDGTREPVDLKDKGKGYEFEKDQFILVEDEELKAVQIESNRSIEIDSFVPRADIDERYLESPYYLAPNEKFGAEAFAVIREAMRNKRMAALAGVVLSSREHVTMLQPAWDHAPLPLRAQARRRLPRRRPRRKNRSRASSSRRAYSSGQGGGFPARSFR